jgi:DNA (cytosine-5)-methyltransferase 1
MAKRNDEDRHAKGIDVVSFFCGCGGLDLGFRGDFAYKGEKFKRTKFNILKAYDFNKDAIKTYRQNIDENAEQLDLSEYDVEQIPKADVLIGGFPCQDFANCGPRRGLTSKRGRLYLAMIKYAKRYRPKMMVGENVPGLENIQGGKVLQTILHDIDEAGYKVDVWKLFAPDYGVPQTRRRLIFAAVRKDVFEKHGMPTPPVATFSKETYRTTKWAIGDLESVTDNSVPNQAQYSRAKLATGGTGQGDDVCHADSPSYTIRANSKGRVEFHYSLGRRLTVRECARIQTFPDDFVFPHNNVCTNVLEIGNAVPPVLGNVVANCIQNYLEKTND